MKINANRIAWAAAAIVACVAVAAAKHKPQQMAYRTATFLFFDKGIGSEKVVAWSDTIHCADNRSLENCDEWAGGIDPVVVRENEGFVVETESGRWFLHTAEGPLNYYLQPGQKFRYRIVRRKPAHGYLVRELWLVPCTGEPGLDAGCRKGEFEYIPTPVPDGRTP
jgi:hypothetical protein